MIRCLILEDEPLAQNVLETYIHRINFLTLVATCENAVDAFEVLKQENVDLIFCDIQLPQITGIEFIKSLKQTPFVIFTTAFSEYAIEGFNVDAIDYLLKPVPFERFLRSVNKAKSILDNRLQPKKPEVQVNHLFVKEDHKLLKINYNDIFFIEGMKDYVKISTNGSKIITHITMKKLEELLPNPTFFRIHKSFIVRIDAIKAIKGNTIELVDKTEIPIGMQYRDSLMGLLNNIN